MSKIPYGWHLCDGSNGTPNLSDRFLEGVTSNVGQWKDAGLPNITGTFATNDHQYSGLFTGAMRMTDGDWHRGWNDDSGYYGQATFNASWSNSIYGKSSTVQPASYTVYYIMKIK